MNDNEIIWMNKPPVSREAAKELLSLPLDDKIMYTCTNISNWDMFTNGNWYVAFSGGKDSTVLLYIVAAMMNGASINRKIRVLFCDTGLEYPEIRKFVPFYIDWLSKKFKNVQIEYERVRPKKNYYDVIRDYGYPVISKSVSNIIRNARVGKGRCKEYKLRLLNGEVYTKDGVKSKFNCKKYKYLLDAPFLISDMCCDAMKKTPSKKYEIKLNCFPIIATMAEESVLRMNNWISNGCNSYEGNRKISNPISFWRNQDILRFIVNENIPICSVYGDILPFDGENFSSSLYEDVELKCTGCQRTGCIFCAFGAHLEKGENRFQRLKHTHPKHWNYAINGGEWDPIDGMWKPSKTPGHIGLGMGRVLDFIGVPYE